jgi:hypothetical protein
LPLPLQPPHCNQDRCCHTAAITIIFFFVVIAVIIAISVTIDAAAFS